MKLHWYWKEFEIFLKNYLFHVWKMTNIHKLEGETFPRMVLYDDNFDGALHKKRYDLNNQDSLDSHYREELGHNEHDVLDFLPLNILCLVKAMVNGLYDYITQKLVKPRSDSVDVRQKSLMVQLVAQQKEVLRWVVGAPRRRACPDHNSIFVRVYRAYNQV